MPVISDIWQPGLNQTGPPPGANNPERVEMMAAETLDELKRIEISASRWQTPAGRQKPIVVLLLGESSAYDGLLQGIYMAYRPDSSDPDDGGATIYSYQGNVRWKKIGT